ARSSNATRRAAVGTSALAHCAPADCRLPGARWVSARDRATDAVRDGGNVTVRRDLHPKVVRCWSAVLWVLISLLGTAASNGGAVRCATATAQPLPRARLQARCRLGAGRFGARLG